MTRNEERMIEIKVRFWTGEISRTKGTVEPRHCWDAGTVGIKPNKLHGIKWQKSIPFNSLMGISQAVEMMLVRAGIRIHKGKITKKYIESNREHGSK